MHIEGGVLNVIGGDAANKGNVISANQFGVHIQGAARPENKISGNRIGTDLDGLPGLDPDNAPLGNLEVGVLITDAAKNLIGDIVDIDEPCNTNAFPSNTIAGNRGVGVRVIGNTAIRNVIRCNSIHDNVGLGIDLEDGALVSRQVTPNDVDDTDGGPNGLLNFPVAVTYRVDSTDPMNPNTIVSGFVEPVSNVIVDFYALRPKSG